MTVTASWPAAVPLERSATKTISVQGPAQATPTPTSTPAPVVTPAATPVATPAPCPTTFTSGKLAATTACFDGGSSKTPVNVNGALGTPLAGTAVHARDHPHRLVRARRQRARDDQPARPRPPASSTTSSSATSSRASRPRPARSSAGRSSPARRSSLTAQGKTQLQTLFALPAKLGGTQATAPVNVQTGAGAPPVRFKVQHATLPGLDLSPLTVRYDGGESWSVDASVQLPQPIGLKVAGGLAVKNGQFSQLYSSTSLGSKHGPVTLERLSFAVEADPAKSKCHAPGAKAAMCGDLALTAGPSLLGAPALSLEGGFGLNLFDHKPSVLKAYGKVKLVGMTLKDAEFEMRDSGYVGVKSKMELGWPGVATIKGNSSIEFQGTKFNGESKDQVCLEFIDYCLGAEALLSTKGIAACLTVDTFLGDWHPGFGVAWGKSAKLYWSGCDLAPYRETFASAAAATARTHRVRFGDGLPGAVIAVTGKSGAPRVAFVGPNGRRVETPADDKPVGGKGYFLMKVPGENLTQLAIAKPRAGSWKVVPLEGTTITSVKSAEGLAKPSVKAKFKRGRLQYAVKRIPGRVVRFTADGKELRTHHEDPRHAAPEAQDDRGRARRAERPPPRPHQRRPLELKTSWTFEYGTLRRVIMSMTRAAAGVLAVAAVTAAPAHASSDATLPERQQLARQDDVRRAVRRRPVRAGLHQQQPGARADRQPGRHARPLLHAQGQARPCRDHQGHDAQARRRHAVRQARTSTARALVVEPDGNLLISSETEPVVRRFDRDGNQLAQLSTPSRSVSPPTARRRRTRRSRASRAARTARRCSPAWRARSAPTAPAACASSATTARAAATSSPPSSTRTRRTRSSTSSSSP